MGANVRKRQIHFINDTEGSISTALCKCRFSAMYKKTCMATVVTTPAPSEMTQEFLTQCVRFGFMSSSYWLPVQQ